MKRKLFTVFVTLLVIATTAFANGVCIDGLYYLLDNDKLTAEVTYKSFTEKKDKTRRVAYNVYNDSWNIKKAVIPEDIQYKGKKYRVTSVGKWAFVKCKNLTSITIPNSVTYIDKHAFAECDNLTSITIPNSVKSIGENAFSFCKGLTSVTIPNSVSKIGDAVLMGCISLKSIQIPSSLVVIPRNAFDGCNNLESVELPNSVETINEYAFKDCKTLKSIGIPNSVTIIKDDAFRGCSGLTSVTIPNSVTSIGDRAFCRCSGLTSVIIGNSVRSIGERTFSNCNSLTSVSIGNSVTIIGYEAFLNCIGLTSVTIPNSVTKIWIGAFKDCTGLEFIKIPGSVSVIAAHAFSGCKNLKSVELSSGLKDISNGAFYQCEKLASIFIPSSVTSIGDHAFSGCTSLAGVLVIPSKTEVGFAAFWDCSNLTIYTSSSASISLHKVVRVTPEELPYHYSFSEYAKQYVETSINEWQKKGEFERMADWQKRVNEQTRQQKIQALLKEAENKYLAFHAQNLKVEPVLGKYDAENEVFAMTDAKYGTMYIAVPINEAQNFKNNWSSKKISPQVQIYDDEVKFSALTISLPNGKKYTYRNTDAVTYNLADIEYNFAPIELDLPKSSILQSQQGQRNITATKVKTGKSDVDTNIPSTTASNPNTFAIIFANEDYKNVASVPFAKNDGSIFQKYCQKTLGIPSSNIHYVENASFNDIRIQLAWLKDVCDAYEGKASVIVYYAGHGIPDEASKSAYLLPVDGDGRYVQSAYKIDEFYQKLGAMNAKSVTVFMDACFSGSKREDGMLASARGVAIKAKSGVPQGKMVVFSAAQGDETAYPNNDEGHGIFTYYLLKKLQETKGDVTLKDLGEYITTNVRRQSVVKNGKPQTPSVTPSASIGTEWQTWKLK